MTVIRIGVFKIGSSSSKSRTAEQFQSGRSPATPAATGKEKEKIPMISHLSSLSDPCFSVFHTP